MHDSTVVRFGLTATHSWIRHRSSSAKGPTGRATEPGKFGTDLLPAVISTPVPREFGWNTHDAAARPGHARKGSVKQTLQPSPPRCEMRSKPHAAANMTAEQAKKGSDSPLPKTAQKATPATKATEPKAKNAPEFFRDLFTTAPQFATRSSPQPPGKAHSGGRWIRRGLTHGHPCPPTSPWTLRGACEHGMRALRRSTARRRPGAGGTLPGRRFETAGPEGSGRTEPAPARGYSAGRFLRSSKGVTSERYSSHSCRLLRRKKS